jgi:transcription antitermination factor NusG
MEPNLKPGDRVDAVSGDFTNFKDGTVVAINGNMAHVTFEIFGRVAGPVSIPVECLQKVHSN